MRILLSFSAALAFGGIAIGLSTTTADAQRYRVVCVAPGAPACRAACGSNTYAVACYAYVKGGRCFRHCGRVR